jgi:hypothetical protein
MALNVPARGRKTEILSGLLAEALRSLDLEIVASSAPK